MKPCCEACGKTEELERGDDGAFYCEEHWKMGGGTTGDLMAAFARREAKGCPDVELGDLE